MALTPDEQRRMRMRRMNMLMAYAAFASVRANAWTPAQLFLQGEQGAWYDPSDLSTMFEDAAGSIPVTAAGQPVGRINDKSGRGNHATQSTPGARPILRLDANSRWYLEFDGSDDSLSTGTINPGSVNKAQAFAGVRKGSGAAALVFETSVNLNSNNGGVSLSANDAEGLLRRWSFAAKGTVINGLGDSTLAPDTAVITGIADISAPLTRIRRNGVVGTAGGPENSTLGTGNFLSHPLFIGARGGTSLYFNGWLYGLIVRFSGANLDAATISQAETWVNGKTGAY